MGANSVMTMIEQMEALRKQVNACCNVDNRLSARIDDLEHRCTRCGFGIPECNCINALLAVADRVEALEAKLKARDHVDVLHADSLKHVIDKFEARIDELESYRVFANDREYDRVNRWHATRDAALGHLIVLNVQGCSDGSDDDEDPVGTALKQAAAAADRAHGPLEAIPEGQRVLREVNHELHVDALVKAATLVWNNYFSSEHWSVGYVHELKKCLKPFEAP